MGGSSTDDSAADGGAPFSNPRLYSDGEKVLACHHSGTYEAKVLKAELRDNEWSYFVHYLGWNKVWDEWVGMDRLLKHNEENKMKQQVRKSGRTTQMKSNSSADAKAEKGCQKDNVAEGAKQKDDLYTKGFLGRDTEGSSQINETNKKANRRTWTKVEEYALLGILEDLIAKGHCYDNGTFRHGTLTLVEKSLHNLFPLSGLKASPHIESKLKKLKKQFRTVNDMVNRAGFEWNDVKKCVEVDSEETWKAYLQHHKEADGWRGKPFPLYDRLRNIFKGDPTVGESSRSAADIDEVLNNEKNSRHVWSSEEEDALLGILEDLVAKGHRYDNGAFRPGTFNLIEDALRDLCPASGLKATPHVESKIKHLKRQCSIVCDMLNRTGFSWNDAMNCVVVDSGKIWKAYVRDHREAAKWRGKSFPIFHRLTYIFDVDPSTFKTTQMPAEIVVAMSSDEVDTSDFGIEEGTGPRPVDQISTTKQTDQSPFLHKKRIREDDTGRSSQIEEMNNKKRRRRWTREEEDALLGILEDLVAKGHRYDNGSFRSGTMTLIEDALCSLCPASGLKAHPHIESRIKKLKEHCSIVCDMLSRGGFSWNNEMKCVEVDNETGKAYIQHHKEAAKWKGRFFPIFDRLLYIFERDCSIVKTTQTLALMVEKVNCIEVNTTDFVTEKDTSPRLVDQVVTTKQTDQSHWHPSKIREDDWGGNSQINETDRKDSRRKWTREEEDALLGILEDLVAKGHRFVNGTFRSGTLTTIENALCNVCPSSGLKARPHILSKLKKLKKAYSVVCDILDNGFGWNDRTKCVVVECEESWKKYVQYHKEADMWRDKQFPFYDILAKLVGVDTFVKTSQALIEAVEGINSDEVESSDLGMEEGPNSRSVDRISTNNQADQSHSLERNRKGKDDDLDVVLNKVTATFMGMMETLKEQLQVVIESLQSKDKNEPQQPKGNNELQQLKGNSESLQSKDIRTGELRTELIKLGLSITDRVKALRLLTADAWNADFFLTLDNEEKLEFVKQLIDESASR